MTPKAIVQLIGWIILLVVIGLAIYFYNDYQALKSYKESADSVSNVTSGSMDALTEASGSQQQVRVVIDDRRTAQDAAYENAINNDQSAAAWDAELIPRVVRESDGGTLDGLEDNPAGSGVADKKDGSSGVD